MSTYHQLPLTTAQVWVRQQVVRSAGRHERQCALAHSTLAAAHLLQAHLLQAHLTERHRGLGCLIQEPVRRWAVHPWRPPHTPCTAAWRTQAAGQWAPMSWLCCHTALTRAALPPPLTTASWSLSMPLPSAVPLQQCRHSSHRS